MRINSPESIKRAQEALERYGSYEGVQREYRTRSDILVSRTAVRIVSRPVIRREANEIEFEIQFLQDKDKAGFHLISVGGVVVNGNTFDNRGHMVVEDVLQKGGFFRRRKVRYRIILRCTPQALALAEKATAYWDDYHPSIKEGVREILIYLPTPGEGKPGSRGYSDGKVAAGPVNTIK